MIIWVAEKNYLLLAMDMAKVGGPLSVAKVFTQTWTSTHPLLTTLVFCQCCRLLIYHHPFLIGIESMLEVDNPAGVVLMLGLVTPQKKRSEGQIHGTLSLMWMTNTWVSSWMTDPISTNGYKWYSPTVKKWSFTSLYQLAIPKTISHGQGPWKRRHRRQSLRFRDCCSMCFPEKPSSPPGNTESLYYRQEPHWILCILYVFLWIPSDPNNLYQVCSHFSCPLTPRDQVFGPAATHWNWSISAQRTFLGWGPGVVLHGHGENHHPQSKVVS